MEYDTEPLFKTIEKDDNKEIFMNTQTGETYTIYKKDEEEILASLEPRMKSLEETLTLIKKYYGKKKRYSRRKKR